MIKYSHIMRKNRQNSLKWPNLSLKWPWVMLGLIVFSFSLFLFPVSGKTANFQYTADFPYAIGTTKEPVPSGGTFQGRLCLLYVEENPLNVQVALKIPSGIFPVNLPAGWLFTAGENIGELTFNRQFSGGYENWFELLQFQTGADLPAGTYEILLTITAGEEQLKETLHLEIGAQAPLTQGELAIVELLLPYDSETEQNRPLERGTLLLRNAEFDYYKNLFIGKGALNETAKLTSPLTHMRLEWTNPKRQSKLILVKMRLLDKDSQMPVEGLISPAAGADEQWYGSTVAAVNEPYPSVLAELDGSFKQMMQLPIYVDDALLKSGEYLLEVAALENGQLLAQAQTPVKIIAFDIHAALITIGALILVLLGLPFILARGRLKEVKSRNLITAGLFGTTAFAVVNVPGNLLNDIFHILLGPFSFLISGMFSGILLYMLLGGLVVLIPKFGIVTLMLMVRMLINMLVFGHISPIALLIYGSQAVLLEASLMLSGVFRQKMDSRSAVLLLAISCGIADAISTYIILQSFSFLYRLFYADWYIMMCMVVSGFIYPAIGVTCGAYLGKELKKVGVD